jgi:thioredoxin reductase (NADPH)
MDRIYDMVIVGGGPGGYTAALYAARAGLKVAVVEKLSAGGQMAQSHQIDNYPGFEEGIDGFELGMRMQQQAERFGGETVLAEVTQLHLEGDIKEIHSSEGILRSRTAVIATGANPRPLGLPEENSLAGRGVHYCAACDGMFYRGKTVIVVGGGNSAVADALTLSRIAEKVILVHRRDTLRATQIYHKPLMDAPNVEFMWNSAVERIVADGRVSAAEIRNLNSGEISKVPCDGVFISIGRVPASGLVADQLELDGNGYIVADESTQSSLPGVFIVGDVRTKALRQVVTAVADGAMAVHSAEAYLAKSRVN